MSAASSGLSAVGELARRHDPDRFLCALFAPPARRETLLLLVALNHELARAREATSQPMLALIRLQWWREVAEGAVRRHEVAEPLAAALASGVIASADVVAMIEGREVETEETVPSFAAWQGYVRATAGTLAVAMGRSLGADAAALKRIAELGTAYGVAGQIRNVAAVASQGRCLLPLDLLASQGLIVEEVVARPHNPALQPVLAELAGWGMQLLGSGRFLARPVIAAALPGVLARRDLSHLSRIPGPRGAGDKIAVAAAAAICRV